MSLQYICSCRVLDFFKKRLKDQIKQHNFDNSYPHTKDKGYFSLLVGSRGHIFQQDNQSNISLFGKKHEIHKSHAMVISQVPFHKYHKKFADYLLLKYCHS